MNRTSQRPYRISASRVYPLHRCLERVNVLNVLKQTYNTTAIIIVTIIAVIMVRAMTSRGMFGEQCGCTGLRTIFVVGRLGQVLRYLILILDIYKYRVFFDRKKNIELRTVPVVADCVETLGGGGGVSQIIDSAPIRTHDFIQHVIRTNEREPT